jgi:flagellar biosynthesis/type III secretory pathway protein FliH
MAEDLLTHISKKTQEQTNFRSGDMYKIFNKDLVLKEWKEGFIQGFTDGFDEGFNEGLEIGQKECVKCLLNMELPREQIIKATGMSSAEIDDLQKVIENDKYNNKIR